MLFLIKRTFRWLLYGLLAGALLLLGPPVAFIAWVAWHEPRDPVPMPAMGTNDFSRLSPNKPAEIVTAPADIASAERELAAVVRRAAAKGRQVSISGARHSMGGQTLAPEGIVIDMQPLNHTRFDEQSGLLTVGAGARWRDVIPYLDHLGRAVRVMQSDNDFSVGGSLSVNCHGWQHNSPPIASTVESLRLLRADGSVITCSPTENTELFHLVLGGYGLFGIILEARLQTVANEFYQDQRTRVAPADYAATYHNLTGHGEVGMAYGRISIAPHSFLREATITVLRRQESQGAIRDTLSNDTPNWLKRAVVRGEVGSDYGKNLRWFLEKHIGESGNLVRTRNQVMNEPSEWFLNRNPADTEILQEYFIPGDQLAGFIEDARGVFQQHQPDLLNITVRNVLKDDVAFLSYAHEEVFGLVMLFHLPITAAADGRLKALDQALVETALAHRGTYYLPYRPHATRAQFLRAYPQAGRFFELKRQYDPGEIFQNQFYRNYGPPGDWPAPVTSSAP